MYYVKSSVPRCPAETRKWRGMKPSTASAALNREMEEDSGSHLDNGSLPEKAEQAEPKMCVLDDGNI